MQDRAAAGVWREFNGRRVYDTGGYVPKIRSFQSEIAYDRTDDPRYMAQKANEVLRHFGFPETARATETVRPGYTIYRLYVDGVEVSGYRQYGSGERKIGMNLASMLHDAVIYRIRKESGDAVADSLTNAMGEVQSLRWKFRRG